MLYKEIPMSSRPAPLRSDWVIGFGLPLRFALVHSGCVSLGKVYCANLVCQLKNLMFRMFGGNKAGKVQLWFNYSNKQSAQRVTIGNGLMLTIRTTSHAWSTHQCKEFSRQHCLLGVRYCGSVGPQKRSCTNSPMPVNPWRAAARTYV